MARAAYLLVALALVAGAVVAFLAGGAWNWLACENEGTEACARKELASAQFTLSIIGFVPAAVLVVAAALRSRLLAVIALAVGVPLYVAWAVLLDAAVHGWDDLRLLP